MIRRYLLPYARPHWRGIAIAGLSLGSSTAFGLLKPWPLKFLFDRVLVPESSPVSYSMPLVLALIGGAIIFIAIGEGFFSYIKSYFLAAAAQRITFSLRTALFTHIQRLSLIYHSRQRTGDLITRVTGDVEKVHELVTDDVIKVVAELLTLVGMGIIMAWMNWQLALIVLFVAPVPFLLVTHYKGRIRNTEERLRYQEGAIASLAQEAFSNIKVMQAYGRERETAERFKEQAHEVMDSDLYVTRLGASLGWLLNISIAIGMGLVVTAGAYYVLSGDLTTGELIVFVSYLRDFYSPLRTLSKLVTKITRLKVRLERVAEVLSEEPEVREDNNARKAPPFRGHIQFEHVNFEYEPGHPILYDIHFTAEPGQVIAIVGPTGSGKSTLVSLLPRLYDPTSGRVLIDGQDIRDFTLESLRNQIAIVLQDTALFRASIWESIAYGRPSATQSEIVEAAQIAGAHDFISRLPLGYDTVLAERGNTLSGGQRQLLAIARALVRNTPLLILDEPTTGLDARSEAEVMAALERLMARRTTLLITHKLSLVEKADAILVLEHGRIVEYGRHHELANRGGVYAQLYNAQTQVRVHLPIESSDVSPVFAEEKH